MSQGKNSFRHDSLQDSKSISNILDAITKGLSKGKLVFSDDDNKVVMKHAWRNALLPVVTIAGLQLGLILSGAVLTESIFGLAGVGRTLFEGITARDFPIIQGFVLFIAIGYVTLNLLIDLSYSFLDPRIRLD